MKKLFLVLGTLFLCAYFAGIGAAVPVQWRVEDGGNGHYYNAISLNSGLSWQEAMEAASSMGGYLSTITSTAENSFVFSLIDSPEFWVDDAYGPWLGGTDEVSEGNWQWVNGEGGFTYTSWEAGQPDDQYNPQFEDYLHYYSNYGRRPLWNDQYSGEANRVDFIRGYIVESNGPIAPVPEPATMFLLGTGLVGLAGFARKKRDK